MERFYDDSQDDDEDQDDHVFDGDEGLAAFVDTSDVIEAMNMELTQTQLDQQLVEQATSIAKSSIFWWFKSPEARMEEVELIYRRLIKLLQEEPEVKGR